MVYMGSKARIVKDIKPYIQDCINDNKIETYIEPFVGGANVISEIECKRRVGGDLSTPLITLLSAIRDDPTLSFAPKSVDFEFYKQIRAEYFHPTGKYSDAYIAATGFFASYAGRFFDGGFARSGANDKRKRDHYRERFNNAQKNAPKLKGIEFLNEHYVHTVGENTSGAFIYCDPPYANTKQYGYFPQKFDYELFYDWLEVVGENNFVLVSEYYMPENFCLIWKKPLAVSLKQGRAQADYKTECLFTPQGGLYDQWLSERYNSNNFQLRG